MKVKVYRNLHKKCFSIVDMKTRKVFKHQFNVVLTNVRFRVSEAGRQRVLKEKRKNVHAYIIGDLLEKNYNFPDTAPVEVYYNPYKTNKFINKTTGEIVENAKMVLLSAHKNHAWIERE